MTIVKNVCERCGKTFYAEVSYAWCGCKKKSSNGGIMEKYEKMWKKLKEMLEKDCNELSEIMEKRTISANSRDYFSIRFNEIKHWLGKMKMLDQEGEE